jgi:hypothetical protein
MRYFIIITTIFIFTNANASFGDWFSSSSKATPVVEKPIVKTIDKPVKRPLVNINTEELVKILDNDPSVLLIDVRAPFEIKHTGTIKRGQNVNIIRGWIETQIADYAKTKDTPIVVYCGRNIRSPFFKHDILHTLFGNLLNLLVHCLGHKVAATRIKDQYTVSCYNK